MLTFKNFLTESDDFTNAVNGIQNDPYVENKSTEESNDQTDKEIKIEKIQKVFNPTKWRKYLQYANAANN